MTLPVAVILNRFAAAFFVFIGFQRGIRVSFPGDRPPGGEWQKAVLRRMLLMEPTVRYPATFCQSHPNALVTADRETAQPPPERPV